MMKAALTALALVAACTAGQPPTPSSSPTPTAPTPSSVSAHRPPRPSPTTASPTSSPPAVTSYPAYAPLPGDQGVGCGVERQAVKTLTDPAAKQVNYTPMDSTVAALRALPVPNPPPTVRASAELRTYRVHAVVTSYKEEADSDIHLAVTDAGVSMIFELISPACLPKGDPLINELGYARNTWLKAHPLGTSFVTVNQAVTVTGVLFFDRIHGQRGVAPNGVEIHPVLTLTLN